MKNFEDMTIEEMTEENEKTDREVLLEGNVFFALLGKLEGTISRLNKDGTDNIKRDIYIEILNGIRDDAKKLGIEHRLFGEKK